MKRVFYILSIVAATTYSVFAQKAHDVLEDGIPVGQNENLFFKSSGDVIKYYIGETPTRPVTITDSVIFLVKNSSVNIYLKPLNPLNYSYKTENVIIIDQIDEDAANALKSVTDLVSNFNKTGSNNRSIVDKTTDFPTICPFDPLEKTYNEIKESLKFDKKSEIADVFQFLKDIPFTDDEDTKNALITANLKIVALKKHFSDIDSTIIQFKKDIDKFTCNGANNPFIVKYVFQQIANELQNVKNEQYKRINNLINAYKLVKKAQKEASEDKDGLNWCFFLDEVPAQKGKISVYTITINKSGYRLSKSEDKEVENNEIIEDETKQLSKNTIRIRRFQRFIPEVSVGIAYTNLNFPKYGTITDTASGKLYVTDDGNELIKRVNLTAMLNYNYFIQNSPVHPFIQLGVGTNIDFPTLLLGGGLRFNSNGKGRIAISTGAAFSWIKTLDELHVGDEIPSNSDLSKDIKYQFATPKIYFGIQYNF